MKKLIKYMHAQNSYSLFHYHFFQVRFSKNNEDTGKPFVGQQQSPNKFLFSYSVSSICTIILYFEMYIYIYIYIYMCVCVCVCVYIACKPQSH